jgi:hypothetical protein
LAVDAVPCAAGYESRTCSTEDLEFQNRCMLIIEPLAGICVSRPVGIEDDFTCDDFNEDPCLKFSNACGAVNSESNLVECLSM